MHLDANTDVHVLLRRECRTFTRYLTGRGPDAYVEKKYIEGHGVILRDAEPALPIDATLLRFAAAGVIRTRIADAYARIFRPHGPLRRKLIFLFAVLENSKEFHRDFTSGSDGTPWVAALRIAASLTVFLLALGAGVVRFAPQQWFVRAPRAGASE